MGCKNILNWALQLLWLVLEKMVEGVQCLVHMPPLCPIKCNRLSVHITQFQGTTRNASACPDVDKIKCVKPHHTSKASKGSGPSLLVFHAAPINNANKTPSEIIVNESAVEYLQTKPGLLRQAGTDAGIVWG